ncbi:MAG: hypothetical protein HKL96_05805 [Phycisphaerales bacterium]|nr:hypothetical protein [Phycisphaerales bacterium]
MTQSIATQLVLLGLAVRHRLRSSQLVGDMHRFQEAVAHEGGDTIFWIDRKVDEAIPDEVAAWPDCLLPLELVMEGLGQSGCLRIGPPGEPLKHRLMIDPIDGTRNIMFDKRSGWFLAALAPAQRADGAATTLRDAVAAVMVELPVSKAGFVDSFIMRRGSDGRPVLAANRTRLEGSNDHILLTPSPSSADNLVDGFAHVTNYFPGIKPLAADLMETIADRLGSFNASDGSRRCRIFDDQYISTGGQMVELMIGHDRMCLDIRPLLARIAAQQAGRPYAVHACHPYDLSGFPVAAAAGVIVTDGFGRPLDAPFDVHADMHWCGYANRSLFEKINPIVQQWLADHGIDG